MKDLLINVAFLRYIIDLFIILFQTGKKDQKNKKNNLIKTLIKTTYETILIGAFIFYYSFLIDRTYQAGIEIISQKYSSRLAFLIVSLASWVGYELTRWWVKKKKVFENNYSSSQRLFLNIFNNTFIYGSGAILGVVLVVFLFLGFDL